MRVLFLTQVLPFPPDSGPKVRAWHVLRQLAQEHEITLVSFTRGDQRSDIERLRRLARVFTLPIERGGARELVFLARSLVRRRPFLIERDDRRAMRDLVRRLAAETRFDVAHADQLNMAQYAALAGGSRRVLDAHNALSVLWRRMGELRPLTPRSLLMAREWRLLERYEGAICREFDAVIAVSDEDRRALEAAAGVTGKVEVLPIALDLDELRPVAPPPAPARLLHVGTMYWPPNVDAVRWFVREAYPLVRARRPDVGLDVIGKDPPKEVRDLARRDPTIRVTGYVDDATPYFERAAAFVVPLRAAGGMRVKILEALARGVPVVSTSIGGEGIAAVAGRDLLVADDARGFAEATVRLLEDRELASSLRGSGRRLVERLYDRRAVYPRLSEIYARLGR